MCDSENLQTSITSLQDKLSYKQHTLHVENFKEK